MVVFSPIFVADTKVIFWYDFVAPLTCASARVSFLIKLPEACNFIKKETTANLFFCEFCKIFKTFFTEHLWATAFRPLDRPDIMYFLPNLYERPSYRREVDNIEIEEFYPFGTVYLNYNSSIFEAVDQNVLIKLIQTISWKILMELFSFLHLCWVK